jgi:hypothetical protein
MKITIIQATTGPQAAILARSRPARLVTPGPGREPMGARLSAREGLAIGNEDTERRAAGRPHETAEWCREAPRGQAKVWLAAAGSCRWAAAGFFERAMNGETDHRSAVAVDRPLRPPSWGGE